MYNQPMKFRSLLLTWIGGAALSLFCADHCAIADPALGLPVQDAQVPPGEIALGRTLFMDPLLSFDDVMACASCHVPEYGFALNGAPTAFGRGGKPLRRNAPGLLNVGLSSPLFRDGRVASLEQQVWGPLLNEDEMWNPSPEAVAGRLRAMPAYRGLFRQVFGEDPSPRTIARALSSFERSLVAADSRFDRWFYGKRADVLTSEEQAGFSVFQWSGCDACHRIGASHATFTDNRFHNIGHGYARARGELGKSLPLQDYGRMEVTNERAQKWMFRTPTLRNIALTGPYMHDGSLESLRDVVDWYNDGGGSDPGRDPLLRRLGLNELQKRQLMAFLRSLTSENAAHLAKEARAVKLPR